MVSQNVSAAGYTGNTVPDMYVPARAGEYYAKEKERSYAESGSLIRDFLCGVIMCLLPVILLIGFKGQQVQEEYTMQGLRAEVISLTRQNEVSRLEIARLDSPACIQAIAEEKLGMKVPVTAVYGRTDSRQL